MIHLGGADSLAVMYYRKWVATSHQSQPMMRLVKPLHSVKRDYSGDPVMGDEIPVMTGTVSELKMASITDTSFIMLYRKAGASTTKTIQGAVRLGELTSVNDNTLVAADEVPIALVGGYGFKRASATFSEPTTNKYCIGYSSNGGYCRSTWAAAKSTWPEYAVKEMGLFAGGAIVSENEATQFNMMPYAALNYIIKT